MTEKKKILVVDDEENLRHMLQVMLKKQGYQVEQAANGEQAMEKARQGSYAFILCDIRMPVLDGRAFLAACTTAGINSTVIMMSAYGTLEDAVGCMKLGAYDYISKPFNSDEISLVLKKAEERERLKDENRRLREEVVRRRPLGDIISRSERMAEIGRLVLKLSEHKTSVLILGESGTGKELVARALHYCGVRRAGPFVAVNCGAIPESLLESELFGHVKGAFTDASQDKTGLFEEADGGTLFLDEISELSLPLQVKLLRVLQEEEIRRVGAATSQAVNVRVVSATSRDLAQEVAAGRFREDLYFRLNVFPISLPALRDRIEDVPLLVDHFLEKHGERMGITGVRPSPETLQALVRYRWPGNVRELENCIERGLVLCEAGALGLSCLPESVRRGVGIERRATDIPESLSIKKGGEALERALIVRALEQTAGNRTRAAKLLEISHRALLYKLKEYELG
ncbi:sigma-54-dependent transcriptional response regulator [Citrifermentans bemidjiense Bem]|uniref:Sigma-54-dependent transcriptional response regulator n=1 Tax=Citrifermentans bemidjiense (strain ATCC BAA-1014 / DSM 16622 / JCM 12645 / Bem) TaxID=404380 RepID=B5E8G7_CITBB|nr:sigma-54 dependent transcriptional regulator [Citrifermentans bemidjiense]ACH38552.1 sigma-54-dependent transcriptional response regulator [Citrifermentans bemidjiense Bem]